MLDLDQAIRVRHSTRMFLPQPVPRELVNEALALAQCAPSNYNIQPWHMFFASGPPRDRLVNALLKEARRRPPNITGRLLFQACSRSCKMYKKSAVKRTTILRMGDNRPVHADPEAHYFGGKVEQLSLVPLGECRIGQINLADWIK